MHCLLSQKRKYKTIVSIESFINPSTAFSRVKMLRIQMSLQNQCMLGSDSDTESDDLSKYFSALAPHRNTKGKGIEEDTASQSVKGWKEDFGNHLTLSLLAIVLCTSFSVFLSNKTSINFAFKLIYLRQFVSLLELGSVIILNKRNESRNKFCFQISPHT